MNRKDGFYIGIIIIVTLILFWKTFLLGKVPICLETYLNYSPWIDHADKLCYTLIDPVHQILVYHYFNKEMFSKGEIPLWNPYIFSGYPNYANSLASVFHPFNIILPFVSITTFASMRIILQFLLSGIFTYFYCREINLDRFSSMIGGLIFCMSGFNMAWIELQIVVGAAMWLPLILLYIERYFREEDIKYMIYSSFIMGLSYLSGHLQISLYILIASSFYIIYHIIKKYKEYSIDNIKKIATIFIIFFILSFCIASFQILPSIELLSLSQRARWEYSQLSFMPVEYFLNLVFPEFFLSIKNKYEGYIKIQGGYLNSFENSMYLGFMAVYLILFALLFNKHEHRLFFINLGLFSILMITGTWIYALFYYAIPPFKSMGPARIIFLVDFSLSVLAAMGASVLIDKRSMKSIQKPFLNLIRWTYPLLLIMFHQRLLRLLGYGFSITLIERSLIILACLVFIELVIRGKINNKNLCVILTILILSELMTEGYSHIISNDSSILFQQTESLLFLKNELSGRQYRINNINRAIMSNTNVYYGLQSINGYDSVYPGRYFKLLNREESIYRPYVSRNVIDLSHLVDKPLLDLLNVKYIVAPEDIGVRETILNYKYVNPNHTLSVDLNEDKQITSIQLSSGIVLDHRRGVEIEDNETIGVLEVIDNNDERYEFNILAGKDTSLREYDSPMLNPDDIMHRKAMRHQSERRSSSNRIWFAHSYSAIFELPREIIPKRVSVSYTIRWGSCMLKNYP